MSFRSDALSMSLPNSSGPLMPPTAVPIASKNAMHSALVSSGKTSLAVRYAALAPADAKKKMTQPKIGVPEQGF